ncbi:MAG: NAD(P)H-binding protein [Alphaproteobacteria bacterium]|nr:NAD(P)H-binding protein [Alphaproteobacteria bacterium]
MMKSIAARPPSLLLWLSMVLAAVLGPMSAQAKERVLIIGGAGHSGSAVAKMLIARGDAVTAFVRPTTDRSPLDGLPVDFVVGDAMKANEVAAVLQDKDFTVMFETVQVFPGSEASYSRMYENFVPWAKRMKVKQFISIGGGCGDNARDDCPLSPPLFALSGDMNRSEHILRNSGVPYTIIRVGALIPSNPFHPDANKASGTSYLTTDRTKFGGVLRVDLNQQIVACIGAERCLNKTFIIDDPAIKPQFDHWICKRANEGPVVSGDNPICGEMPSVTADQLTRTP